MQARRVSIPNIKMTTSKSQPPFRVIVVGAGISGLFASHCLQKAGIDHVVLEKYDDVHPPEGASISIYPQVNRILQQIGCYDQIRKISLPHQLAHTRRPDGTLMSSNILFQLFKQNHGHDVLPLERREFLRILYDGLPDKNFVKAGSKIQDIAESSSGVEVKLSDGTVEKGDMVLGCDGTHSFVRGIMWDHANKAIPGFISEKEKNTFKQQWKCLIGIAPEATKELCDSDMTVVHDDRFSFLLLAQPSCTFFFVLFYLDRPIKGRTRYTNEQAEALAATLADHPITPNLKFGDIWDNKVRGALVSLEEGVLEHWHHGRLVLAGDAVHKMTPNIALGGNTAMEDVAALTNHLHRMLSEQGGSRPSAATLEETFAKYQQERMDRAKQIVQLSGIFTRAQARINPIFKFASYLIAYLPIGPAATHIGGIIRGGPKLDFLDAPEEFGPGSGNLSWEDDDREKARLKSKLESDNGKTSADGGVKNVWRRVVQAGVAVGTFVCAARFLSR